MINKLITAIMLTTSVFLMADVGVKTQPDLNAVRKPYQTALHFVQFMGDRKQNHP